MCGVVTIPTTSMLRSDPVSKVVGAVNVDKTVLNLPHLTPDPESMRQVLGHFGSGIVVITAAGEQGPVGMTCQSFTSLSLDPPLVSFSPSRASVTWPSVRRARVFGVNVLAADQSPLSTGFARTGTDKFAGVQWTASKSGAPILEGVSAWIECMLWNEYEAGDHTIVVGEVTTLAADPAKPPLLFHRGRYLVGASAPTLLES